MAKVETMGYDRKYRFALDRGVVTCIPQGRYSNTYKVFASDGAELGDVVCRRDTTRAVTKKNWFIVKGEVETGPHKSLMLAAEVLLNAKAG